MVGDAAGLRIKAIEELADLGDLGGWGGGFDLGFSVSQIVFSLFV